MIVKVEQDVSLRDIEVLIKYGKMYEAVQRVLSLLQSADAKLKCSDADREKPVSVSDVYYIESVDKRTFVYCESEVYRTDARLYQLLESLAQYGFVQINKACLLNINVLVEIRPLLNSRMEATLKNGERLNISRKYLAAIREALQEEVYR